MLDIGQEQYRCVIGVEEGGFYAHGIAVHPLTIPEDRLDAVAETLATWNATRPCGRFRLDVQSRSVSYVMAIPVESIKMQDPIASMSLLLIPTMIIAGNDAAIRAVADGAAPLSVTCADPVAPTMPQDDGGVETDGTAESAVVGEAADDFPPEAGDATEAPDDG